MMTRRVARRIIIPTVVALTIGAPTVASADPEGTASGYEIIDHTPAAGPMSADLEQAMSIVHDQTVEVAPADFGLYWVDRATSTVHVAAANEQAQRWAGFLRDAVRRTVPSATVAFERVKRSLVEMQRYQVEVDAIAVAEGADGTVDLRGTSLLGEINGVIAYVGDHASARILAARLAARAFDPGSVLIDVNPRLGRDGVLLGRQNDSPPFRGGSNIKLRQNATGQWQRCTAGFSALDTATGTNYMLTAGHCAALGSSAVYAGPGGLPDTSDVGMGHIMSALDENWAPQSTVCPSASFGGNGTLSGGSQLVGDTARIKSSARTQGRVFRGDNNSTTTTLVSGISPPPYPGMVFRTSGTMTGEISGWTVMTTYYNSPTTSTTTCWRNQVITELKEKPWVIGGDSGSPAFSLTQSGQLQAVGLVSGGIEQQPPQEGKRLIITQIRHPLALWPNMALRVEG